MAFCKKLKLNCKKNMVKKVSNMNENKTNINWLACIYDVYHLKPYKIGIPYKCDLVSFNKKRRKIIKKHGKIFSLLRRIRVLACNMLTHL